MSLLHVEYAWVSQTWPIKRRCLVFLRGRRILTLPMRTVEWSRTHSEEQVILDGLRAAHHLDLDADE